MSSRLSLRLRIIATAAVAAAMLTACSSSNGDSGGNGDPGDPVAGGTLRLGVQDAPADLDPQTIGSFAEDMIKTNISDKLIYQNPKTGELEPWLATAWTNNDQFTEFVLTLRDDVTFSDGTALTADVVKENLDLLAFGDESLGVPPQAALLAGYESTEVSGDNEVTITFTAPNAGFLPALSGRPFGIVGEAFLALSREERAKPENVVASGPFVVGEHIYQQSTTLDRRKGYDWAPASRAHSGDAYLDAVEVDVVPESGVRVGSLQSDETDAITDVNTTDEKVLSDGGFTVFSRPIPGRNLSLDFNLHKAPSNDLAVREAIQYGWDRDALKKTVLTDSYDIATSIVPTVFPGYVDLSSEMPYDPDKSEQILDDAGWTVGPDGIREKDGAKLVLEVQGNASLPTNQPALELIQANLRDIGIQLDIKMVTAAEWVAGDTNQDPSWNINAYAGTGNDPSWLRTLYSPLSPSNRLKIDDTVPFKQELIDLTDQLIAPLDDGARMAAMKDVQEAMVHEWFTSSPIYSQTAVAAMSSKVHGLTHDNYSRMSWYDAWLQG